MLTGELRGKIDTNWNAFWSGGISNPLEVIEQITYLLFIRDRRFVGKARITCVFLSVGRASSEAFALRGVAADPVDSHRTCRNRNIGCGDGVPVGFAPEHSASKKTQPPIRSPHERGGIPS